MRPSFVAVLVPMLFSVLAAGLPGHAQGVARGTVYEDANANGVRDPGERGLPEVLVSNGTEVAATDGEGHWQLPASRHGCGRDLGRVLAVCLAHRRRR